MKIVLFMAQSVNGYIAKDDGSEEFISNLSWNTFVQLAKEYRNLVIGRKTYEKVKNWGEEYSWKSIIGVRKILVSGDSEYKAEDNFEKVSFPEEAIFKLDKAGFETMLVAGGSNLNSSFAKLNHLDEIIINIEPVILGSGIPLFNPTFFEHHLELLEVSHLPEDIVQLRYKVI